MKRIAPPTIYPSVRRRVEAPYLSLKAYAYYMVWCGMVWYGMVWYGMVWYGIAYSFGMTWHLSRVLVV